MASSTPPNVLAVMELPLSWVLRCGDDIRCRCLWGGCGALINDFSQLPFHMNEHITVLSLEPSPSTICPIVGCGLVLNTFTELRRHLHMHVFHAKRQAQGFETISRREDLSNRTSCGFAPSTRIVYEGVLMRCDWIACGLRRLHAHRHCIREGVRSGKLTPSSGTTRIATGFPPSSPCQDHYEPPPEYNVDCTVGFRNKANLRVHVRHHSGDKETACPFCGAFFASNAKLFGHLLRKQAAVLGNDQEASSSGARQDEMLCILCQKRFDSDRLLREHCRRHVMKLKCDFCTMTVDCPSALHRHIFSVHAKKRNYNCTQCDKRFAQRCDLERHLAIHSDELEFVCDICEERFRWRKQLVIHERKHEKDYKQHTHLCHLCEAKYANGYGLSRHLVKKHNCPIPDGFTRFQYKKCADGFARLQTKRCLSKALAKRLGITEHDTSYVTVDFND